jgi:restriction system protein
MLHPEADYRATLDPKEFELLVRDWLARSAGSLDAVAFTHREQLTGMDGAYQIDLVVRFTAFGADLTVLVECKDWRTPVSREEVQVLSQRLQSTGAHKGILVATNGFQRAAVEYATAHGIALVRVLEGKLTYEVKAEGLKVEPPPWTRIPKLVGYAVSLNESGSLQCSLIDERHLEPLQSFLGLPVFEGS